MVAFLQLQKLHFFTKKLFIPVWANSQTMSIKSFAAKIFAKSIHSQTQKWASNPIETQQKVFSALMQQASETEFGKDHNFSQIKSHSDFTNNVPVRDYEGLKTYVEKVVKGEPNILWKGKPLYFAKTSGTTSGAKYIPLTKESMPFHIQAARNAILSYIHETGKADFVDGKMIFLQGSPTLEDKNGIKLGRLSGIVAHFVPAYLQKNRMPSWETNCIEDWETKVNAIVNETINEDMAVISGIPSWVQMYFEKLKEKANKPVGEIFKNFHLFIYGGVNYEPYRAKFENLIGRKVDSIELFPASEGFFAYQDSQKEKGMLLLLNSGIFYEFIKANEFHNENAKRYTIGEVELGVNYVLIISTNAGLWAYNIGDTVQFTSLKPYRIIVSGRIKHFISAFGEHVIAKEVESALQEAIENTEVRVNEFTVAPQINPTSGLPYHEWFIEFENEPNNLDEFALKIDKAMRKQNAYYDDLIVGKVLRTLVIFKVTKNGFQDYMKSIGKLGGQNKLPRLSDNREIADKLSRE
ncbi:GH3 auxin-responsive promoter family protein [Flavobacterium gelidilacus]